MRRALVLLLLALPASASAAYAPTTKLDVSGTAGGAAAMSMLVTQARGEEPHRTIELRLPGAFGFNSGFVHSAEPIGRLAVDTSYGRFDGAVHLTEDFRLVAVIEAIGLLRFDVEGVIEVLPGQELVVRFDDLPNVQLTRLAVDLEGGQRTPLAMPRACGRHVVKMRLVGRSGVERPSEHPVDVAGCRSPLPKLTEPRVTRGVLRWKTSGAARTEVTLRRLVRGRWREVSTRTTTRTSMRVWRRAGAAALVPVAADGTRGLTKVVRLR